MGDPKFPTGDAGKINPFEDLSYPVTETEQGTLNVEQLKQTFKGDIRREEVDMTWLYGDRIEAFQPIDKDIGIGINISGYRREIVGKKDPTLFESVVKLMDERGLQILENHKYIPGTFLVGIQIDLRRVARADQNHSTWKEIGDEKDSRSTMIVFEIKPKDKVEAEKWTNGWGLAVATVDTETGEFGRVSLAEDYFDGDETYLAAFRAFEYAIHEGEFHEGENEKW